MATFDVSLSELAGRIKKDMRARQRRVLTATRRTAAQGVKIVRENVPVAFGGIVESLHVDRTGDGAQVIADAPEAAAVENGSRPHTPPLAPLIAWVKLRGMQGLKGTRRLAGTTSSIQAQSIAASFKALEQKVGRRKRGMLDVSAPEQIARGIQQAIAKNGTKPHFYMGGCVPVIEGILESRVAKAMDDSSGDGAYSPI